MDKLLMSATTWRSSRWNHVLVISAVLVKYAFTLEEPSPEIFLRPKNFNPHPYEVADRREGGNGPVLFPPTAEDNLVENKNNFVTARNFEFKKSHPIDSHPYSKVVKKQKYKLNGRLLDENNEESNHAYKALAKHATKVLSYPPEELGKNHIPSRRKQQGKNYEFSYKVVDHLTGDDFSHSQSRNSKATNGEYRVKLPDGRVQIVSYTADKNGYKADVKYTENEEVAIQRGTSHQDSNVQIHQIPVREIYPHPEEKSLNYHGDVHQPNHNVLVLQAIVPTQIPAHFNDNGRVVVSPIPAYLNAVDNADLQNHHQPKVEIYTTNARDYSIGSYVPSTVLPYVPKNIEHFYQRSSISPRISNNGNHGLYVPSTASSFIVTDQHGQVLDNIKFVSTTTSPLVIERAVSSTTSAPFVLDTGHYHNLLSTTAPPF